MIAYLFMALLSAAALLLLTRPWWQRGSARILRRGANVAVYKSRLAEIETEAAAGLLDQDAADALREEQGRRLLADAEAPEAPQPPAPSRLWWVMLLLPLFAGVWYALAGSWRTQALISLAEKDPQAAQAQAVEGMVARLAARLNQQPDDAEGWAMLGRSYGVLRRHAEAAEAYARANRLAPAGNPDWLVGEGEALALSRAHDLQGEPLRRFEAALALDPAHLAGLWFAGLAAAQREDGAALRRYWQPLLLQPDLPQEMRQLVAQRLGVPAEVAGLALTVNLSLAPALQAQWTPEHTLFVFAKPAPGAAQGAAQGPRLPLAAQKQKPAKLPLTLRLDDTMAMMPELKLSQFSRWVLTARLSRSGTPQAQPGDLEGSVTVDRAEAARPVQLLIDRRIE